MSTEVPSSRIMQRLTTLFPSTMLEEHAEELGVIERESKLQIPALVWAFVSGFAAGESPVTQPPTESWLKTNDAAKRYHCETIRLQSLESSIPVANCRRGRTRRP